MRLILFGFFIGSLCGCELPEDVNTVSEVIRDEKGKIIEGTGRSYYKSGKIKAEVEIKDRERNGLSKMYYEDGVIRSETNYVAGKKEGKAVKFYENGQINLDYVYLNDELHGVQKKYRENGLLKSEANYKNGNPGLGLKEYLVDGKPKTKFPKILIEETDRTAINGEFTLTIRLSDDSKKAEFFWGKLDEGKFLYPALPMLINENGKAIFTFTIPPGTFMVKELNFIAKVKTRLQNYYIVEKKYNLAIENRL